MWERFTERTKHVVSRAQLEARRLGSEHVCADHILLGLCNGPDGVAVRALKNLGVDIKALMMEIEQQVPRGNAVVSIEDLTITPRAKKVLTLAVEYARSSNLEHVGTGQILLGLVKEGEGIAAKALQDLNIDFDRIQAEILRILEDDNRHKE